MDFLFQIIRIIPKFLTNSSHHMTVPISPSFSTSFSVRLSLIAMFIFITSQSSGQLPTHCSSSSTSYLCSTSPRKVYHVHTSNSFAHDIQSLGWLYSYTCTSETSIPLQMAKSHIWIVFLQKPGHATTLCCCEVPGTLKGTIGLAVRWQDLHALLIRIKTLPPLWIHGSVVDEF